MWRVWGVGGGGGRAVCMCVCARGGGVCVGGGRGGVLAPAGKEVFLVSNGTVALRTHASAPAIVLSIGGRVAPLLFGLPALSLGPAASLRRVRVADGWVSLTDTFGEPLLEPC